jgi:hypothetical protein
MSSLAKDSQQTILPHVVKGSNRCPPTLLRFPIDGPLRSLRFMGATNNASPHNWARHFPEVLLIIQQAIPYQTHGGTCCPGGSTPKNWSLADSSKNHPQTMKVATFPTVSWPCSNPDIYQLRVHSHHTGWKTTNHHKRPQDNSTSRKMEDLINDLSYIMNNDSTI